MSQFKLSEKFTIRVIFLLAIFGLFTSISIGVNVWQFNTLMEDKVPPLPVMVTLPDDIEYLKTRIRYLEEEQSSTLNDDLAFILTSKVEKHIWFFHVLFQFVFMLSLYMWYVSKNKGNKSVPVENNVT